MDTEEAGEEVDDCEDFIYAKRQKIANVDEEIVKNLGGNLAEGCGSFGILAPSTGGFSLFGQDGVDHSGDSCTSVPSERAFSMGDLIFRDERASLNGETIEMLMRMQDWYKKLPVFVM